MLLCNSWTYAIIETLYSSETQKFSFHFFCQLSSSLLITHHIFFLDGVITGIWYFVNRTSVIMINVTFLVSYCNTIYSIQKFLYIGVTSNRSLLNILPSLRHIRTNNSKHEISIFLYYSFSQT